MQIKGQIWMQFNSYPLSFRHVEDILHERVIDISHETIRFWVAWSSLETFVENGKAFNLTGAGIWTKSSSKFTANCITHPEPSTTRAKFLNAM